MLTKPNKCDHCQEPFSNKDMVTVILYDVEVSTKTKNGDLRLKLSEKSIATRAYKVFCVKCLNCQLYPDLEKEIAKNGVCNEGKDE